MEVKKIKNSQKIKCDVHSCKYNDCDCNECNLNEIKVSCDSSCQNDKVHKESQTVCHSFKKE